MCRISKIFNKFIFRRFQRQFLQKPLLNHHRNYSSSWSFLRNILRDVIIIPLFWSIMVNRQMCKFAYNLRKIGTFLLAMTYLPYISQYRSISWVHSIPCFDLGRIGQNPPPHSSQFSRLVWVDNNWFKIIVWTHAVGLTQSGECNTGSRQIWNWVGCKPPTIILSSGRARAREKHVVRWGIFLFKPTQSSAPHQLYQPTRLWVNSD